MIKKALHTFKKSDYHSETVIGEFSGRDSVAAIMKAFESDDINYILPIASFAGSEYGDFDGIFENFEKVKKMVDKRFGDKKKLYPLIEYNREEIWHLMNGRYIAKLTKEYDFMSPCIGCHLYFHLIKLNFAKALSGKVISGERESHDGRIKVNQCALSLDAFISVMKGLGVELLMPLRNVSDGDEVERLIGFNWVEGENHPKCVLSGNYRDTDGKAIYDEEKLKRYLKEYLIPIGKIVGSYILDESKYLKKLKNELDVII